MKELRIPPSIKSFGAAIRWARTERGMTMRQLCEPVGVTPPFLSDLEHGRRTTNRVEAFARALGVSLADLEDRLGMNEELSDWLKGKPELVRLIRESRRCRCRYRLVAIDATGRRLP